MSSSFKGKKISIEVSKTIGKVSANILVPPKSKAMVTLAHGAGAGMDHPFMSSLADALAARSIATIRYNFPFKENGKGRPDPPAVAEKTVETVIAKAHELYPDLPLFASGKSFGGRMTSQRLSKGRPDFVKGIVFFGFPLHAPGSPSMERANHLSTVPVPLLFLQGTRDALANMELVEMVIKKLPHAVLKKFEGADHSFKAGKNIIIDLLADATSQWVDDILLRK